MNKQQQIYERFYDFLVEEKMVDIFIVELRRAKGLKLDEYVNGHLKKYGPSMHIAKTLIRDSFPFLDSIQGPKYWFRKQRKWLDVCNTDFKTKPYNSIW